MFVLHYNTQFKKDLKRLKKRSRRDFKELEQFTEKLLIGGYDEISPKFKPHKLKGNYKDCCECHVLNDLLLIWSEDMAKNELILIRTGTHSDLF